MPELPEVETVARQLAEAIIGRRLISARIFDSKLAVEEKDFPCNFRVTAVVREGKQVVIQFSRNLGRNLKRNVTEQRYLVVHLRMTGRLVWFPEARPKGGLGRKLYRHASAKKPRAELVFDRGRVVFEDVRRFGTFQLHRSTEAFAAKGIDPMTDNFTPSWLTEELGGSKQEIKAWLLRQDKLVGLGNIYACEALFRAGIHPTRKAFSLEPQEIIRLHQAVRQILIKAIESSGTTFSDYQDARGRQGSYQRLLKVYDREGAPCRRCKTPIERIVQQQRSTYLCPACQPDKVQRRDVGRAKV